MKTLQELYNEIIGSEDLKAAFTEAAKSGKVTEFLKARGVDATAEEVAAFLKGQTGEVSDEELDNVAGGCGSYPEEQVVRGKHWYEFWKDEEPVDWESTATYKKMDGEN